MRTHRNVQKLALIEYFGDYLRAKVTESSYHVSRLVNMVTSGRGVSYRPMPA